MLSCPDCIPTSMHKVGPYYIYIILKQREINVVSKILSIRGTFEEKFYKIWKINTFANKYDTLIIIKQTQEKSYSLSDFLTLASMSSSSGHYFGSIHTKQEPFSIVGKSIFVTWMIISSSGVFSQEPVHCYISVEFFSGIREM